MKVKPFLKDRIILSIIGYFGFEPENIRQTPIIPGRYYNNFGNIVKAVPITQQERLERQSLKCDVIERQSSASLHTQETDCLIEEIESGCGSCPFFEKLPCPLNLVLDDGSKICYSHKFVIISKPSEHYV